MWPQVESEICFPTYGQSCATVTEDDCKDVACPYQAGPYCRPARVCNKVGCLSSVLIPADSHSLLQGGAHC